MTTALEKELRQALDESKVDADYVVIDVLESPEKAMEKDVYATPTLLRVFPEPVVKVIANAAKMSGAVVLIKMPHEDTVGE